MEFIEYRWQPLKLRGKTFVPSPEELQRRLSEDIEMRPPERYRLTSDDVATLKRWIPDFTPQRKRKWLAQKLEVLLIRECGVKPEALETLTFPMILSFLREKAQTGVADANVSLEARSLGVLAAHPEWSDTAIAKHLGCARTSLYRSLRFKSARALQRREGNRGRRPFKDPRSGNLDVAQ